MDDTRDTNHVKKIISEYNTFLKAWGHSDNWNQSQFKTLEDMIFEATKTQVNVSTLKRFFQQRTGNPQLATKEALCKFLGYAGYTDFVLKMSEPTKIESIREEVQQLTPPELEPESPQVVDTELPLRSESPRIIEEQVRSVVKPVRRGFRSSRYINMLTLLVVVLIGGYLLYHFVLRDCYTRYLVSQIEFSASKVKGTVPHTITFSYNIPPALFDDITVVYQESNGDITERKLKKDMTLVNASFIYEGEGFCKLKYKDEVIKTIPVAVLRQDWSVYVREERKDIFKVLPIKEAYHPDQYMALPIEKVPEEARASHLFVSYVFYRENLVDGDNFIFEAKMRNSENEYAIPCSDMIMYINSDTQRHGFAMNENGYAYLKFISGENEIRGDEHNLSRFNFNSSQWHVMGIKVENKKTTFSVDGEVILDMGYTQPFGMANELILRFKGCGAVDYVKVSTLDGEVVYYEDFKKTTPLINR